MLLHLRSESLVQAALQKIMVSVYLLCGHSLFTELAVFSGPQAYIGF